MAITTKVRAIDPLRLLVKRQLKLGDHTLLNGKMYDEKSKKCGKRFREGRIKLDRIKRFSMKTKIMIIPRRPYMIKLMDFMMKRRKNDGHFGTT